MGRAKINTPQKEKKKKVRKKKEGVFSPWLKGVVQGVLDYVDDDEDTIMK
jgi:cell division protein FtsA